MMVSNAFISNSWFSLRNEMICDLMLSFTAAFAKKMGNYILSGGEAKRGISQVCFTFFKQFAFYSLQTSIRS